MYVEFYIDQFFAEHFLTGVLLLQTASLLEKQQVSWRRIGAGSLVNAGIAVGLICLGVSGWYFPGLLAAGIITYTGKGIGGLGRHLFFLLFLTVCFGGTLEALLAMGRIPLLAGTAAAVMGIRWTGSWLERRMKLETGIVEVTLTWQERTVEVHGLIDSGNRLTEPMTGRPVSILDEEWAEKLLGREWTDRRGLLLIPYHSIGTDKGWLKGVTIDRMTLGREADGRITVTSPVIAIYPGIVSGRGQYQMILHPMHTSAGIRKQEECVK